MMPAVGADPGDYRSIRFRGLPLRLFIGSVIEQFLDVFVDIIVRSDPKDENSTIHVGLIIDREPHIGLTSMPILHWSGIRLTNVRSHPKRKKREWPKRREGPKAEVLCGDVTEPSRAA
jgi:hypothetical protein